MTELVYELQEVNPTDFYGAGDENFKHLKTFFPKLKLMARGSMIKAHGEPNDLTVLESRLDRLVDHLNHYNSLNKSDVEQIVIGGEINKPTSEVILHGVRGRIIQARSENQLRLVKEFLTKDMVFAVGPAGTGKTYTGVALAVRALKDKEVRRIILTRPAVEAGENLGFLPGDMKEKLDPYMQPLYDALNDMIPAEKLNSFLENGVIQIAPLAFMRGRTLDDAFVILDEAQNTTVNQMKMFLTRMGMNAKFMITGDPGQVDLPHRQRSGLQDAIDRLRDIKEIGVVELDESDVVRHPLVKKIIGRFKEV